MVQETQRLEVGGSANKGAKLKAKFFENPSALAKLIEDTNAVAEKESN